MRKPRSEEAKKNIKEAAKKRRPVSEETKQKMRDSQKEFWSSDKSNEARKKLSIAQQNRIPQQNGMTGKHWYTNGEECGPFFENEVPEGWVPGYLYGKSMCGEQNSFYGKNHSIESKQKMSNANKDMIVAFDSVDKKVIRIPKDLYHENKTRYFNTCSLVYRNWKLANNQNTEGLT